MSTPTPARRPHLGWAAFGIAAQVAFVAFLPFFYWFLLVGSSPTPDAAALLSRPRAVDWWPEALANVGLLALFAVPHSILLATPVRRRIGTIVPPQLFGSLFTYASIVPLALAFAFWQPLPGALWAFEGRARAIMIGANAISWAALGYSMSLMGLGYQTGLDTLGRYLRGLPEPRRNFEPRGAYRLIRHPIYVSFLLVSWTTPTMTSAHLALSLGFTLYALIGSVLKDRRLAALVGEPYRDYMARVTGFPLIPSGPLARVARVAALGLLAALVLAPVATHAGETHAPRTLGLGPTSGELQIEVKKRGALKAFAHDHVVAAPIESGTLTWRADDPARSSVAFKILTKKIRVVDPAFSDEDRAKVQTNMESDEVLDVAKYPEITFASESVVPLDPEGPVHVYSVVGKLTLHGTTRVAMIKVRVKEDKDALVVTGEHVLKQTDYGIEPYSTALGAVGVQDEVRVSWTITAKTPSKDGIR